LDIPNDIDISPTLNVAYIYEYREYHEEAKVVDKDKVVYWHKQIPIKRNRSLKRC